MEDWDFESNFKHSNFSIWSRIIKAETETFKLCLRHVLGAHAGIMQKEYQLGLWGTCGGGWEKTVWLFFCVHTNNMAKSRTKTNPHKHHVRFKRDPEFKNQH